jgi:hypothetical protein
MAEYGLFEKSGLFKKLELLAVQKMVQGEVEHQQPEEDNFERGDEPQKLSSFINGNQAARERVNPRENQAARRRSDLP